MKAYERLLNYVKILTPSNENSQTVPSSDCQFDLARVLENEMKELGLSDVYLDDKCYLYGKLPATKGYENCPAIGFIAHMDTSPDASGKDIHPQIIKDYQGQKITLNEDKKLYLDPEQYPQLLHLIHHDLITTDGTTLLGADDKAGIAIIMQMVEYLHTHPEFKHNDIQIAFTPDEEIGCGSNHFDVKYFNADYAYTIDGGDIHIVEYENFNAFSAKVNIHGRSIHPGSAKNKMVNSTRVAYEFDSLLPVHMRPESTEGYEGFNHLHAIQGTCEETTMDYIIRNHDLQQAKKQCQEFIDIAEFLNKKYGYQIIDLTITESYLNMKEALKDHMFIVEQALAAIKENGLEASCSPIRGGTDGARLTFMGLPCPNLGTGGFNYHGPYEYCSLTMMEKQVEILLHILKNTTK